MKPKFVILILAISLYSLATATQTPWADVLAATQGTRPISEEECQQIFDQLKMAKGFLPGQKPHLKIVRNLSQRHLAMASTNNQTGIIEVEKRLIGFCNDLLGQDNRNGLAFILSHELAHFYKHHNVVHPAIQHLVQRDLETSEQMNIMTRSAILPRSSLDSLRKKFEEISRKYVVRKNESEADLEAGFICYLAGFNGLAAGPIFLKEAYKFYGLDTTGGRYPSLNERQEIVRSAQLNLDTLTRVFELGNLLTLAGQRDLARQCYLRVLDDFSSADLYNNLGLNSMLEGADNISLTEVKYFLPFSIVLSPGDIDKTFVIDENTNLDSLMMAQMMGELANFHVADEFFQKAIDANPESYTGHLNLGINHFLQYQVKKDYPSQAPFFRDELIFALSSALKARECLHKYMPDNSKAMAEVLSMLGVIECALGNGQKGGEYFLKATEVHPENTLAHLNLQVFNGADEKTLFFEQAAASSGTNRCAKTEKMRNQQPIGDFLPSDEIDWHFQTNIKVIPSKFFTDTMRLYMGKTVDTEVYNLSILRGSKVLERYSFIWTNDAYTQGCACGSVGHGTSLESLQMSYGHEGLTIQEASSTFITYQNEGNKNEGIIFKLKSDNTLSNWIFYNFFFE